MRTASEFKKMAQIKFYFTQIFCFILTHYRFKRIKSKNFYIYIKNNSKFIFCSPFSNINIIFSIIFAKKPFNNADINVWFYINKLF